MTPKISILVPVYQVEQYLLRCINSVLSQSFLDWELILVDDGSIDQSSVICDKCAEANSQRVFVVHKDNGGLPSARLVGFQKARGEYLVFLDADDWLLPDALQILYNAITEEPGYDIVKARPMRHDGVKSWKETYPIIRGVLEGQKAYGEAIIMNDIHPYLHSGIYRKDLFSESVFEPIIRTGISFGEDWFSNTLIIDKVRRVRIIDISISAYYVNTKSMVGTSTLSRKVADSADTFLYDYLNQIDESLSSFAYSKNYFGALNDLFKPEIPFHWSTYKKVRDFFNNNSKFKKRVNKRYLYFINCPFLFYIYAKVYSFLFYVLKLKCKRRKMV